MELAFKPHVDHRKWSLDASWASVLLQIGPEGLGRLEIKLDWASCLCWTSLLVFSTSTPFSKYFMTLSNVSKQDNC